MESWRVLCWCYLVVTCLDFSGEVSVFVSSAASPAPKSGMLQYEVHGTPGAGPVRRLATYERRTMAAATETNKNKNTARRAVVPRAGRRRLGAGNGFKEVPLFGDYERMGYYYTYVEIGSESDPQLFSLIVDSGSALTVVPCRGCNDCGSHMDPQYDMGRSSTAEYVKCGDADCYGTCSGLDSKCRFSISYSEGSSLRGDNIRDLVAVGGRDYHLKGVPFVFGCATTMTNLFKTQLVDGIMGVNNDKRRTIVDSLRDHHGLKEDVFSLCLSYKGGAFVLGGYNASLHVDPKASVAWEPFLTTSNFFEVKMTDIRVGGVSIGLDTVSLNGGSSGGGWIVDSGTTFTWVPSRVFGKMQRQYESTCSGQGHCEGAVTYADRDAMWCYRITPTVNKTEDDLLKTFPSIKVQLQRVTLVIPPQQYFFSQDDSLCIGIFEDMGNQGIFGMNLMQDYDVIFHRTRREMGWMRARCHAEDPRCIHDACYCDEDGCPVLGYPFLSVAWFKHNVVGVVVFLSVMLVTCTVALMSFTRTRKKCCCCVERCCRRSANGNSGTARPAREK